LIWERAHKLSYKITLKYQILVLQKQHSSRIQQQDKQWKNNNKCTGRTISPTSPICSTVWRLHKISETVLGRSPLNAASEKIALNHWCSYGFIDLCCTLPLLRDNRWTKIAEIAIPLFTRQPLFQKRSIGRLHCKQPRIGPVRLSYWLGHPTQQRRSKIPHSMSAPGATNSTGRSMKEAQI
jgi:hypothetical protein